MKCKTVQIEKVCESRAQESLLNYGSMASLMVLGLYKFLKLKKLKKLKIRKIKKF